MSEEKIPGVQGYTEVRYGGRTIQIILYINTNEDLDTLQTRVSEFVKDSGCCPMIASIGKLLTTNVAIDLWRTLKGAIRVLWN